MAEQEFLVSFAVDIDEAGLEAIQQALSSNTALAEGLAAAFSTAQSAIGGFFDQLSASTLSTGETRPYQRLLDLADDGIEISMELDMGDAEEMLDDFLARAEEPARLTADPSGVLQAGESALDELMALYEGTELPLNADASGVVAAGSEALSELESLYASTTLTVKVKEEKVGGAGSGSGGGSAAPKAGSGIFSWLKQSAAGGRYTERTETELAEDGNPEYVIPVKKESLAVPLLRQLLGELSDSARETLREDLGAGAGKTGETLAGLPDLLSSAKGASSPVIQQTANSSVQAPVSIQVQAAGADPEAVGRSVYDVAERYWLRTVEEALA